MQEIRFIFLFELMAFINQCLNENPGCPTRGRTPGVSGVLNLLELYTPGILRATGGDEALVQSLIIVCPKTLGVERSEIPGVLRL